MRILLAVTFVVAMFAVTNRACNAQPLVTGDLAVYYSFDAVGDDGLWVDGSGNNLHGLTTLGDIDALEDGLDDIRLDTNDSKRGAGSVWFDTEPAFKEDYIAVCDPVNQPDHNDGCGEPSDDRPSYVATNAFTVAAWMKVEDVGQDHSVWQTRDTGGAFTHIQVQGSGGLRMQLRGEFNSNIAGYNDLPNGEPIPYEEWFHYAGTYSKGDDPEGPGELTMYLNGEEFVTVDGGGSDAELDFLGDWGSGAFVGLVPDFNRQLVGRMDELYVFNRALDASEIQTLFTLPELGPDGDYNGNGALDAGDLDAMTGYMQAGTAEGDLDGDGDTDLDDRTQWISTLQVSYVGDSNFDGEFNSGDFVAVFTDGLYETGNVATYAQGDWNGDTFFNSGDFVAAFSAGGYELGPRAATAAVPEPTSLALLGIGLLMIGWQRRR